MNAFDIIESMAYIDDDLLLTLVSDVYAPKTKNYVNRKSAFRMLMAVAVAISIIAALGLAAYAISSIHQRRQEQLRQEYKIEENRVTSYVEYPEPTAKPGVSLVSAISGVDTQRVYVNIYPVSEELVRKGMDGFTFGYILNGDITKMAGYAYDLDKRDSLDKVEIYLEDIQRYISVPDPEAVWQLILDEAYDLETATLTLSCSIPLSLLETNESIELTVISFDEHMAIETNFGTVTLDATESQRREITLPEPYAFDNTELNKTAHIVSLTVYPIGAIVHLDIPDAELYYDKEELTSEEYLERLSWVLLTDKIYKDFKLIFSDGSELLLLGADSSYYQDGLIGEKISWNSTIDIDDIVAFEIMGEYIELDYVN